MTNLRKILQHSKHLMLVGSVVASLSAAAPLNAQVQKRAFQLRPSPTFIACAGVQGGPNPTATVTVTRGELADTLTITGQNFQPNLDFDLFTIQRSNLLSNGQIDPNFTNFGQAWYQTDVESDSYGNISANIKTIL